MYLCICMYVFIYTCMKTRMAAQLCVRLCKFSISLNCQLFVVAVVGNKNNYSDRNYASSVNSNNNSTEN